MCIFHQKCVASVEKNFPLCPKFFVGLDGASKKNAVVGVEVVIIVVETSL